jgi:hypothetical protein
VSETADQIMPPEIGVLIEPSPFFVRHVGFCPRCAYRMIFWSGRPNWSVGIKVIISLFSSAAFLFLASACSCQW